MTQLQVEAKFRSNAARLSAPKQNEIIRWTNNAERRDSVAELMSLLRV